MTELLLAHLASPLGSIQLVEDALTGAVCALEFDDHDGKLERKLRRHYGDCKLHAAAARQADALHAYFAGELQALSSLPAEPAGTPFQLRVWAALREIPVGETTSYGELARRIGRPGASRAVGAANGQNPVSLILPCHRVIGADGSLTGYGGGLARKEWLLRHEGALASPL